MKVKLILLSSMILLALFIVSLIAQTRIKSSDDLVVYINSSKLNYSLGEVVSLNLEIKNQSMKDIYLYGANVKSGYLKILVSSDGEIYKEYLGTNWVNDKSKGRVIKAKESINSDAKILSNSVPDTTNLSDVAIREFGDKQLMTVYAFPRVGDYYIKAVLIIPNKDGNKKVESEPLKIRILKPEGEDLIVWNKIKDRADFAYFIQEGEFVDFKNHEERTRFQQEIEEIINLHQNSLIVNQIEKSLERQRKTEERRKAYQEKLKQPN